MKKRLFLMALLLISQATWAARILPNQIQLAVLQQVNYPRISMRHSRIIIRFLCGFSEVIDWQVQQPAGAGVVAAGFCS